MTDRRKTKNGRFPEGIENDVELPEEFFDKGAEELDEDGAGNSGDEAENQPEDRKKNKKSLTSRQKSGKKHNHSIINVASLRNQKAQKTPRTKHLDIYDIIDEGWDTMIFEPEGKSLARILYMEEGWSASGLLEVTLYI